MAEVKPLKLVDAGGGQGQLREFAAGDTLPAGSLPPNVAALAGLAGVADRLPYFTGAGALSLATLTAKARALLDDADAAAMQATLELIKQTSATDTTAGALMLVGAFGLGGTATVVTKTATELDSATLPTGFYRCDDLTSQGLPSGVYNVLNQRLNGTTAGSQVAIAYTSGKVYRRTQAGSWSSWHEIYTSGSILGTVSQSGGVPTGAIIERGSNANGEYVRYADGTQICYGSLAITNISTATGAVFVSSGYTWTLPAEFIAAPRYWANPAAFGTTWGGTDSGSTASSVVVRAFRSVTYTGNVTMHIIAIGRWY